MVYNLTNISTPVDMVKTAHEITNGGFGIITVLLTFVIALMYLSTHERPFGYSFAIASYLTTIIAVMMKVVGALPDWVLYLSILFTIGGVAYTVFSKGG